jgi:hypothetical protein
MTLLVDGLGPRYTFVPKSLPTSLEFLQKRVDKI